MNGSVEVRHQRGHSAGGLKPAHPEAVPVPVPSAAIGLDSPAGDLEFHPTDGKTYPHMTGRFSVSGHRSVPANSEDQEPAAMRLSGVAAGSLSAGCLDESRLAEQAGPPSRRARVYDSVAGSWTVRTAPVRAGRS